MSVFSLIFILTFGSGTFSKSCSRVQSKFVREYFARSLLPLYQKYSQPIPEKCPFSPLRDMYHYHENNKTKLDTYRWKCEICGKLFAKELHLDNHFDNRHINTIQTVNKYIFLMSILILINYLRTKIQFAWPITVVFLDAMFLLTKKMIILNVTNPQ